MQTVLSYACSRLDLFVAKGDAPLCGTFTYEAAVCSALRAAIVLKTHGTNLPVLLTHIPLNTENFADHNDIAVLYTKGQEACARLATSRLYWTLDATVWEARVTVFALFPKATMLWERRMSRTHLPNSAYGLAWTRTGKLLVCETERVVELNTDGLELRSFAFFAAPRRVDVYGNSIVVSGAFGVALCNYTTGERVWQVDLKQVKAVRFIDNGDAVAVAAYNPNEHRFEAAALIVLCTRTGERRRTFDLEWRRIDSLAQDDGQEMVLCCAEMVRYEIAWIDLKTGSRFKEVFSPVVGLTCKMVCASKRMFVMTNSNVFVYAMD